MASSRSNRPRNRLPLTHRLARGALAAVSIGLFVAIAYAAVYTGFVTAVVDGGREFAGWARGLWSQS